MTIVISFLRRMIRFVALVILGAIVLNVAPASAQSLGSAQSFGALGATTVTNTGLTILTGDLGVSPGTAITGFPPGVVIGGTVHAADAIAARAQADAGTAYAALKAMACAPINNLSGQILGTQVLSLDPGVYCFNTSAQLNNTLFLAGAGPWIFQIGTTLTTGTAARVVVVNPGATCSGSNVFWQVGSSATLGTATQFVGNILAAVSITATTGVRTSGTAVALTGAVTMDTNNVSACPSGPVTPPGGGGGDDDGDDHDGGHDGDHHGDHDGDHDGHHGDKDHKHHDKDRDGHGDKDHDKDRKNRDRDRGQDKDRKDNNGKRRG